ncbi:MAG: acyloxyacyl hydrolase [Chitinophagales bacterium]
MKSYIFGLLSVIISLSSYSQEKNDNALFFLEPESHIAFVVPNYGAAPKAGISFAESLSLGWQTQKDSSWQSYYGFPQTGIQFTYLQTGNLDELGRQYSLNPFITFNKSLSEKSSLDFKLGLGVAYHTAPYDSLDNPKNQSIGGPVSWFFNANMYYRYALSKRIHLKIGGGFWHASNGHTTLPNFGQNYAAFGIGLQYYPIDGNPYTRYNNHTSNREKHFYLRGGYGIGIQEYGGTTGPKNGPKYITHAVTLSGAILFRKHLLVKSGLTYRYYDSYASSHDENEFPDFSGGKGKAASNLIFFLGTELLFGHVSFDLQGGLNLWKPYFTHFYDHYEEHGRFDRGMKRFFNTRVGINLYAINTAKLPKHNVSIGAFMHANSGQADYTSIAVNYTCRLK